MEKSSLKNLFEEIDLSKKKPCQGKKNDEEKYKTKPTKPDFGKPKNSIIGIKATTSSQYKGLTNYGNICYSNVVMQCLNGIKEFSSLLKETFTTIEDLDSIEDYPILY